MQNVERRGKWLAAVLLLVCVYSLNGHFEILIVVEWHQQILPAESTVQVTASVYINDNEPVFSKHRTSPKCRLALDQHTRTVISLYSGSFELCSTGRSNALLTTHTTLPNISRGMSTQTIKL
jgi:hypothetical protein